MKVSKCTALVRPKSFKKFARLGDEDEDITMRDSDDENELTVEYGQLTRETRYSYDPNGPHNDDEDQDVENETEKKRELQEVEKEELIRGYKYGSSFVPVPEDNFPKLETKRGMEICGFFKQDHFRREWCIDEVRYVFAAEKSPLQQVAVSSLVRGMFRKPEGGEKEVTYYAVTRWVTNDGSEPKMGVLRPVRDETVDYFLWVQVRIFRVSWSFDVLILFQVPFADDLRKWTFPSLERLISSKGELVSKHPYIPTNEQKEAMENLVDALDLMQAGEKDEEG